MKKTIIILTFILHLGVSEHFGQSSEMRYITSMAAIAVKTPSSQGEPKDTVLPIKAGSDTPDFFDFGNKSVFVNFTLSKPVKNILDELQIKQEEAGIIMLVAGSRSDFVSIVLNKENFDKENISEVTKVKVNVYSPGDPSTIFNAVMANQYLSKDWAEPSDFMDVSKIYLLITKKGKPVNGVIGLLGQGFKCDVSSQKRGIR